jgi:UDP-3-O-[3-hydroxymyristoyl] N-acetylglucosamine deacetylase
MHGGSASLPLRSAARRGEVVSAGSRPVAGEVVLEGRGLHTGEPARVVLRRVLGAVRIAARGGWPEADVSDLEVAGAARSTTVSACHGRLRLATVEHAFSALAGLHVRSGVLLAVEGPEMPLLDGGSARFCAALAELGVAPGSPFTSPARVAEAACIEVGASRYEFAPADAIDVEVTVDFGDPRIAPHARWEGDPEDYRRRIAPARTFALARDLGALLEGGLARYVDPESVVLFAAGAVHHAGAPPEPDEPARHKLLDLLGDLYLQGGPPLGRLRVFRPGHAANAGALREAWARGVIVARRS